MDSEAAAMDALASEAAAGVADSVVTRLGQKNGQDLKSDGYRTWIVPKGRKADQETLKAYVNSKLCLVRLTPTPTPSLTLTLTRTRTRTRTRTLTLTSLLGEALGSLTLALIPALALFLPLTPTL